jgi:hypothetical protein
MKQAPLKAQKPAEEEVAVAEVFTPPPATQATAQPPRQLPQTASLLPLVSLCGLLSLAMAGLLRMAQARVG